MIKMARVPIVSVLLLTCFVLRCHSLVCPPSCSCRGPSVLNCSLAGLWTMPKIPDSVTHLDVSHNGLERVALLRRTLPRLRSLSLANNSIARLSLCIHGRVQGRGCDSWAPNLHLLSVERNQLRRLPRGLSALEALEVLRLSFNSITTIQLGELDNLRGLRELHLQHNLISSLHSDAFRHLQQLKILNVSFNMLTSLNPSIYLSLHTIGADVHLAGNRWRCDCNMRSIRRWMALDRSRGSRSWDLVCASPPILAGADVLEVEDDDLNCWSAEKETKLHQDVTVHRDSQVLLSCATKGGLWRTPAGLVPANQPHSGLLVSAITEKNTGLYVCLSDDYQVVSVFHLQIAGTSRKARSVTERIAGGERSQTVTQSDLTLAVCLSVFITFLVAFILGLLLRPCIDMLWKRITRKKTSNPVSSAEERQYDNEAYSAGEDPEELQPHRERRVTFSTVDFQEEKNVKYNNKERETKANGTVVECEMVTDEDSGSEKSLERRGSEDRRGLSDQNLKRRGSLSDSSLSDKDEKEVDIVQQSSTELPPISMNKTPGFAFEPILHPNNGHIFVEEPEDDEEQFEFSDRSTSPRTSSPVGSYNYTSQIMPRLNRKDSSNSSSYMSDNEPSEYTVNPDLQEEEDVRRYAQTKDSYMVASLKSASGYEPSLDQDTELWWPAVDLEHSMRVQRRLDIKVCEDDCQTTSFSEKPGTGMVVTAGVAPSSYLSSSDSEETRQPVTVPPRLDSQTQRPALDLEHTISVQRYSDIKAPLRRSDSSSGTDSEDGSIHLTQAPQKFDRAGLLDQEVRLGKDTTWPAIDLQHIPRIERHLNVKSTLPDSFSSRDSKDVRRTTMLQPPSKVSPSYDAQATWPSVDLEDSFRIQRRLDVKATSPTLDASSDSDNVVSNYITKPEQETRNVTRYPIKAPPTPTYDPQSPWPSIDLEDCFRIKRRLNIKVLSPPLDSTTHDITKQEQGLAKVTRSTTKASSTPNYYPHGRWPIIDLEDSFRIKRRLNVKGPPSPSDSSSSSDSEHETINHITKHEQRPTQVTRYSSKESPTPNYDPHAPWPTLNLEDSFRIKRRLNVKATSPILDASSDSDNVVTNYITKPEQVTRNVTRYPIKAPPTPNYDPQSPWPSIDLEDSFRIKRRLNVKVLSPPSDSSSIRNRDYGTTHDITKQEQGLSKVTKSSTKASSTPSYYPHGGWPKIDLEDSFRIKRRLNVKGPLPPSDLSSNTDSEHETIHHITKHEQIPTHVTRYYSKESPTPNHDPHAPWPTLNLADSFRIKRRLDVKTTSPILDASSDTDDDMTNHITELEQETIKLTRYPMTAPSKRSYDPESPWPSIDLEDSFRIKRRLNVKGPSPPSDSLSSSNSEHETIQHITKHVQRPTHVTRYSSIELPVPNYDPHATWPTLDLEDSFRIKRRLDVQITSPTFDVSSDSESDDEVSNYITKPDEETRKVTRYPMKAPSTRNYDTQSPWPSIDLEDSFRIKRRLNVKGPSPPSDSSSSSNSEHETIQHITKHEQRPTHVTRYSSLELPMPNYDPRTTWPTLNLKDSFRIKRRLDVKARSTTLDTSSDSDSNDVMTNYITKPEQVTRNVTRYPMKAPLPLNHDTQSPWPAIDLENSFKIKRRLNVKVLSPPSDLSSIRNRDHGTTHDITKQEQGLAKVTRSSTKAPSTPRYYPHGRWPIIDLEDSFRIKRRLNVRGPLPPSDLSSSTDSEIETIHHTTKHDQRPTQVNRYSSKGSPKPNYDPHAPWPTLNLADSFRIKRRLDVKATSTTLEASSDSESDDEVTNYIRKPEQDTRKVTGYPIKATSTSYDPQATWPMVDLDGTFRIKRRLNVKELSATSDSSSSSNSKNEMTLQPIKQKQGVTTTIRYPMKLSSDPEYPWPSLDFKDSFRIKRRLDFKAPLPTSDLTSSSEIEDETMYYTQKQGHGTTKITSYAPKPPSYGPQSTWPTLDLENSFRIKRRLDINAPSSHTDSLSSSDREYDIIHHIIKQDLGTRKTHHPINVSPRISSVSQSSWPSLDLEDSFRIKRRLNFQVLSHVESPGVTPWPSVDLGRDTRVRWRLDIKAAPADVSHGVNQPSSSNKQDDTNGDATETQALPRVYLGVSRRLDIKVSSPQQKLPADRISPEAWYSKSTCSTSDSDEENQDEKASLKVAEKSSIKSPAIIVPRSPKKDSNIKLEKYVTVPETVEDKLSNATPEINSELQSRWANMHLGFSRFRKRLEITSHACEPPVVPLSESDPEQTKQKHTVPGWQGNTESPLSAAQDHDNALQPAVGLTSEGKSSVIGLPRIRRYLDVKAPATLKQGLDSSSSSEDEADSTEYSQWRGKPHDLRLSSLYATRTVETQQTTEKSQVATVPRQPSSNISEEETGEVAEASETTEVPRSVTPHSDSPIPYRRLIIKPSSLPNDTSTTDQHTDGMTTLHGSTSYQLPSLAPKTIPNPRSVDYMSTTREIYSYSYSARPYKARNQTLYVAPKTIPSLGSGDDTPLTKDSSDVNISTTQSGSSNSSRYQIPSLAPRPFRNSTEGPPAAIRWTGLRTRLSDPSKHPDSSLPSPLGGLPKSQAGSLTMEVAQENRSTTVTRSLHLGSNSLSSFGTDEMWKGASKKTERKGLSALKAMSDERQTWDKDEKVKRFQPSGNSGNSNQNRSEDLVSYTSASIGEDLPYDILRYRTHALTQEIPPPVLTTPLPDEDVELTRNSKSSYTPSISQV